MYEMKFMICYCYSSLPSDPVTVAAAAATATTELKIEYPFLSCNYNHIRWTSEKE